LVLSIDSLKGKNPIANGRSRRQRMWENIGTLQFGHKLVLLVL